MKEDFLQYVWANSLYKRNEFTTYNGKKVRVLRTGEWNRDAGPDFFNARVAVDDVILAGNVEVHVRSSDWYRHGHHEDVAYNSVVLSVVQTDDVRVYDSSGREIECIVLEAVDDLYEEYEYMKSCRQQPACAKGLESIEDSRFFIVLQGLAFERLERKVGDMRHLLEQTGNDWEECFYRFLCKYWAGNVNSAAFYQLAQYLPYKILLKYANRPEIVEALIFGVSGLLEKAGDEEYVQLLKREYAYYRVKHQLMEIPVQMWRFMRIRPDNFPTVRLALLADFVCHFQMIVSRLMEAESLKEALACFDVDTSSYWDNHYAFQRKSVVRKKQMGIRTRQILLINAVVPFLFLYAKEQGKEGLAEKAIRWLEETEAESN